MSTAAVRERPMIFSAESVRAILAGTKTQTRRVVKPQPPCRCIYVINGANSHALCRADYDPNWWVPPKWNSKDHRLPCPHGVPGDRLWVKEAWTMAILAGSSIHSDLMIHYKADGQAVPRWKSPLFMSRDASRITLEITDVRVERLQEITESDVTAEGATWNSGPLRCGHTNHVSAYKSLWDSLNAKRGHGWDVNPWVWAIGFKRLEAT